MPMGPSPGEVRVVDKGRVTVPSKQRGAVLRAKPIGEREGLFDLLVVPRDAGRRVVAGDDELLIAEANANSINALRKWRVGKRLLSPNKHRSARTDGSRVLPLRRNAPERSSERAIEPVQASSFRQVRGGCRIDVLEEDEVRVEVLEVAALRRRV